MATKKQGRGKGWKKTAGRKPAPKTVVIDGVPHVTLASVRKRVRVKHALAMRVARELPLALTAMHGAYYLLASAEARFTAALKAAPRDRRRKEAAAPSPKPAARKDTLADLRREVDDLRRALVAAVSALEGKLDRVVAAVEPFAPSQPSQPSPPKDAP